MPNPNFAQTRRDSFLRLLFYIFLLVFLLCHDAVSQVPRPPVPLFSLMQLRLPPINPAARPASLGGAFIGVANDATAAAINPAGLSYLLRPEVSLSQALGWQKREFPVGSFAEAEGTQSQANLIFDQTLVNIVYPQWGFTFALFRQVIFRSESDFSRSQFLTIAPARRLSLHEQLGASGNFPGISSQSSSEVVHIAVAISKALHRRHRLGLSFRSTQLNLQLHEKHYFDPELWLRTSFANGSVQIGSNHAQSLYRLYELQENELKPSWSAGILSELHPNLTLGIVYEKLPAYDLESKIFLPAYRPTLCRIPRPAMRATMKFVLRRRRKSFASLLTWRTISARDWRGNRTRKR